MDGVTRRTLLCSGGVAIIGSVAGCVGGDGGSSEDPVPVEDLEISLRDARKPDIGATSASIGAIFDITNTNEQREIPSPEISYNVLVNDVEVLSTREAIATFESGESRLEEFTITIAYEEVGQEIVEILQAGQFTLQVAGSVESDGEEVSFEDSLTVGG